MEPSVAIIALGKIVLYGSVSVGLCVRVAQIFLFMGPYYILYYVF